MKDFFQNLSPFSKTRLILSGWYTFILMLILVGFSIALTATYSNDVTRIVLKQDFGNHVPTKLSQKELHLIVAQVRELRNTSRLDILVIDIITIVVGGGLSFFLAGKTLEPIQKSTLAQKTFVADASHELKSPVATIQSASEVALRSTTKTKKDYAEALQLIHTQSIRLGKLINDLLSLSVLDAENVKHFQRVSLSEIVSQEIETFLPIFQQSKLSFAKSILPNVFIYGAEAQIRQLVVILLDNAVKYTQKKGKISVTVENRPHPHLIVEDTGIGIAVDRQKDIFRRFYQIDSSHAGKGAGLGLAIAESIMQIHKGKINIESMEGKGSKFTCIFPTG